MNAGRLSYFLTPMRLETVINPDTGEITRRWTELTEIRAERVKVASKAVTRGNEDFVAVDAVYYIRWNHDVRDGDRIRERGGNTYEVVVEPNREKGLKLLKCTKVND